VSVGNGLQRVPKIKILSYKEKIGLYLVIFELLATLTINSHCVSSFNNCPNWYDCSLVNTPNKVKKEYMELGLAITIKFQKLTTFKGCW
jgi:hypothetical protein